MFHFRYPVNQQVYSRPSNTFQTSGTTTRILRPPGTSLRNPISGTTLNSSPNTRPSSAGTTTATSVNTRIRQPLPQPPRAPTRIIQSVPATINRPKLVVENNYRVSKPCLHRSSCEAKMAFFAYFSCLQGQRTQSQPRQPRRLQQRQQLQRDQQHQRQRRRRRLPLLKSVLMEVEMSLKSHLQSFLWHSAKTRTQSKSGINNIPWIH